MYTYKLGGMMITDELYHDDLDSMTFGRKDQNELYHYGIKGMQHGKRRFQNEDGSLTMAGRRRYDVGNGRIGSNVGVTDSGTGSRSGGSSGSFNKTSAVNRQTFASSNRPSGGRMTNVARTDSGTGNRAGGFSAARNAITASSSQSVKNSANSGKKAADNLFSKIGNAATGAFNSAKQWGNQAAQDVANTATNAYNGARDLAGQAVDAVKDKVQDVTNDIQSLANTPEARDIANGVNSAIDKAKELGAQVSGAAQNAYNGAREAAGQVGDWVGDRARDVSGAAQNAYNGARELAGQAVDAARSIPQNISDWYTGDKAGREAQRYDNVVQNFERNGERNINEGTDKISDSIYTDMDRIDFDRKEDASAYYAKNRDDLHDLSNKQFREGLNQRNLGYDQHDVARQYGRKADEAQARYDAAPRQRLAAAGDWIRDRASDVGNVAGNAANAAANWVGDRANDIAGAAKNVYNDIDYGLYSLGQDIAQPAVNRAWQDFRNRTAQDREIYNREFPAGDYQTWKGASNRIDDAFREYQKESNRIENNPIGSAINNIGRNISEGAQNAYNGARELAGKAGQAASNAASSVRDWGAGAVDKGREAFENLFGRSEPPVPTLSDPNPQIETETILREDIIPEQRITEQLIPEQRITEQRIPEQRITEQRIPEQRITENRQQEAERARVLSDKPSGLSDEYWMEYKANGGTRAQYERELKNRRNNQNGSR